MAATNLTMDQLYSAHLARAEGQNGVLLKAMSEEGSRAVINSCPPLTRLAFEYMLAHMASDQRAKYVKELSELYDQLQKREKQRVEARRQEYEADLTVQAKTNEEESTP